MPVGQRNDGAPLRMRRCEALIKALQDKQACDSSPGDAQAPGYSPK